jgi:hypothetical protein
MYVLSNEKSKICIQQKKERACSRMMCTPTRIIEFILRSSLHIQQMVYRQVSIVHKQCICLYMSRKISLTINELGRVVTSEFPFRGERIFIFYLVTSLN